MVCYFQMSLSDTNTFGLIIFLWNMLRNRSHFNVTVISMNNKRRNVRCGRKDGRQRVRFEKDDSLWCFFLSLFYVTCQLQRPTAKGRGIRFVYVLLLPHNSGGVGVICPVFVHLKAVTSFPSRPVK